MAKKAETLTQAIEGAVGAAQGVAQEGAGAAKGEGFWGAGRTHSVEEEGAADEGAQAVEAGFLRRVGRDEGGLSESGLGEGEGDGGLAGEDLKYESLFSALEEEVGHVEAPEAFDSEGIEVYDGDPPDDDE
jgi:hypothetical protein